MGLGLENTISTLPLSSSLKPCPADFGLASLHNYMNILFKNLGSSYHGSEVMNPTSIHEDAGLIPGLTQWINDSALP